MYYISLNSDTIHAIAAATNAGIFGNASDYKLFWNLVHFGVDVLSTADSVRFLAICFDALRKTDGVAEYSIDEQSAEDIASELSRMFATLWCHDMQYMYATLLSGAAQVDSDNECCTAFIDADSNALCVQYVYADEAYSLLAGSEIDVINLGVIFSVERLEVSAS